MAPKREVVSTTNNDSRAQKKHKKIEEGMEGLTTGAVAYKASQAGDDVSKSNVIGNR